MTLPLILTMIVRDEADNIGRVLESVRGVIDGLALIDTGSTDDTVAILHAAWHEFGVPGVVGSMGWPGRFDVARNEAWDLASRMSAQSPAFGGLYHWRFVLDADSYLHESFPGALRQAIYEAEAMNADGIYIESRCGELIWRRGIITRSGRGWRYVGRLHETAVLHEADGLRSERAPVWHHAQGVWLEHPLRQKPPSEKGGRSSYVDMMLEELKERPDDPRVVFYAAQTLADAGRWGEARALYEQRIRMDADGIGWKQEAYIAALRVARRAYADGWDVGAIRDLALRAVNICPDRPEAIELLGEMCRPDSGRLFAEPMGPWLGGARELDARDIRILDADRREILYTGGK